MSIYTERLDMLHTSVKAENVITAGAARTTRSRRRFIIIPVVIAAVIALTGAVVHEVYRYGFKDSDIISGLKVGRYYLETTDGYDYDCYVEVYDDNTLRFFGLEKKDDFGNGNHIDWNSAPVKYGLLKNVPFIAINDAWDTLSDHLNDDSLFFVPDGAEERAEAPTGGGGFLGIGYKDENTLETTADPDELPNAKDFTEDRRREEWELLYPDEHSVMVHFVYEGVI